MNAQQKEVLNYNILFTILLVFVSYFAIGSLNPLELRSSPPIPLVGILLGVVIFSYSALFAGVCINWLSLFISFFHRPKSFKETGLSNGYPKASTAYAKTFALMMTLITVITFFLVHSTDWRQLFAYNPSSLINSGFHVGILIAVAWLLACVWLLSPVLFAEMEEPPPSWLLSAKQKELQALAESGQAASDYSRYYDKTYDDWIQIKEFQKGTSLRGNDLYEGTYRDPSVPEGSHATIIIEQMKEEKEAASVFSEAVQQKISDAYEEVPVQTNLAFRLLAHLGEQKGIWEGFNGAFAFLCTYYYDYQLERWIVESKTAEAPLVPVFEGIWISKGMKIITPFTETTENGQRVLKGVMQDRGDDFQTTFYPTGTHGAASDKQSSLISAWEAKGFVEKPEAEGAPETWVGLIGRSGVIIQVVDASPARVVGVLVRTATL